jgi:hypothetical protein
MPGRLPMLFFWTTVSYARVSLHHARMRDSLHSVEDSTSLKNGFLSESATLRPTNLS